MKRQLKAFGQNLRKLAAGKRGLGGIAVASFLETTIIPIPVEVIVAPLMAASRRRGMAIATATLVGSVIGAVALYLLSWGLFDHVVAPMIDWRGLHDDFYKIEQQFRSGGFWLVFVISITPAPMQLAALAAGVTGYSFPLFVAAIVLSRALRYYGLLILVRIAGSGIVRYFGGRKAQRLQVDQQLSQSDDVADRAQSDGQ